MTGTMLVKLALPALLLLMKSMPMNDIWTYIAPLAILAFLVLYTRVAKRVNIPGPIYWTTMIAGGFLLMSIFTLGT